MPGAPGPAAGARLTRSRRLLFALLTALCAALLAELLLFAAERASPRVEALLRGASRVVPDARLGQRPNPALPEHDAAGWRNAVRPARAFAVAIGDSQTYGDEVAREDAWPQRLAELSGRAVYNLALGGYGPVEYERLLPEALALEPELVLVGLYAGNDFADAYLSAYPRALAPELRSGDAELVRRAEELDARGELKEAWERTRAARKGWRHPALARALERLGESSRLAALASATARAASAAPARRDDFGAGDFPELRERAARAGDDLLLPFAAGELSTVFTPAARVAVIDTGDPRVEEGLRITLEAIARMAAACAGRCRLAVVAIPSKELVFSQQMFGRGAGTPKAYAELALREALIWERVRRALADAGVPLVDTLPALRALVASGRNPYRGDWNGHPIAAGNQAIAEAVLASGVLGAAQRAEPALP
jgi:hypothetical protein